jgi:hypothetical protein
MKFAYKSRLMPGAFLAAGVLGGGLLVAAPSAANPIDPYYTIINANSGKCLAIGASSTVNGTPAIQWPCTHIDDQRWYLRASVRGTVRLVNVNSGKCLAIGASRLTDGAPAIQWDCANVDNQRWLLNDANGAKTISARHSGKCLSIEESSTANRAVAIQYRCWGGDDQRWYLNYHA